ncbi:MAG: S-methyl-5'-thioinosine phosphorylase [Pseudomonadota bacterium]
MKLAIIGGSGTSGLFDTQHAVAITTPFGAPSARPREILLHDRSALFLPRHGDPHRIPPHKVNYRANLHALKALGAERVLAINAVGGIDPRLKPGSLVIPDQLIDYSWGRDHTYSDGGSSVLQHIEFAQPFAGQVRGALIDAAERLDVPTVSQGCYAVTQGPRLETAAEIQRLARDGNTIVGMTAMPETALARELGLDYACICLVANAAAGLEEFAISLEAIHTQLATTMVKAHRLVLEAARNLVE